MPVCHPLVNLLQNFEDVARLQVELTHAKLGSPKSEAKTRELIKEVGIVAMLARVPIVIRVSVN